MKITIGFCYKTMSPTEFMVRVIRLWSEVPEVRDGGMIYVPYRHSLAQARNEVVKDFLALDSDALLMLDTDILFEPQDVKALAAIDADIAAGAYMTDLTSLDAAINTPTGLMMLASDPLPETPGSVDFAGAGFMLVQRRVFEKIGSGWFDKMKDEGTVYALEDYSFCERARDAGFGIILDPNVRLGHIKSVVVTPGSEATDA